ncbi:uncharacterized membrane protein YhaH (DUF805 family) [Kribbella voronezhensis]|uniref:Uncharacterized membrane protein YhaH (DUF805 family) n=1 Tax=Kribbella voronezhensis TaxID=2512212 RepID=A0A4R7T479_9ACTN|nr:DUF805 domain-containing protein [Kribbella voronezhensis]TDU86624.1 uncharacterized membrane protein YhaH (DUF805 family) [Kribbella voronezhensis]
MQWYTDVLKKYIQFSGRARRKEFWMFALFNAIISIVLSIIDNAAGLTNSTGNGVLGSIYSLAVLLPSLAVAARRLHDTDRSALWLLLIFVIVIGWIVLLVFYIQEGTPGDNKYGPDPKAAERFGAGTPNAEPGYPTA